MNGKNLWDDDAAAVFEAHISVGHCKPTELWVVPKITKQGLTSSWNVVKKHYAIISEILEKTRGGIPLQKDLTRQFSTFLKVAGLRWSISDIEKSTYHLRSMLRSLRALKAAPRGHESLGALIAKFDRSGEAVEDLEQHEVDGSDDDDDDVEGVDGETSEQVEEDENAETSTVAKVDPTAVVFRGFRFDADVVTPWGTHTHKMLTSPVKPNANESGECPPKKKKEKKNTRRRRS